MNAQRLASGARAGPCRRRSAPPPGPGTSDRGPARNVGAPVSRCARRLLHAGIAGRRDRPVSSLTLARPRKPRPCHSVSVPGASIPDPCAECAGRAISPSGAYVGAGQWIWPSDDGCPGEEGPALLSNCPQGSSVHLCSRRNDPRPLRSFRQDSVGPRAACRRSGVALRQRHTRQAGKWRQPDVMRLMRISPPGYGRRSAARS